MPKKPYKRKPLKGNHSRVANATSAHLKVMILPGLVKGFDEPPTEAFFEERPALRENFRKIIAGAGRSARLKQKKNWRGIHAFTANVSDSTRAMFHLEPNGQLLLTGYTENHRYGITEWKKPGVVRTRIQSLIARGLKTFEVTQDLLGVPQNDPNAPEVAEPGIAEVEDEAVELDFVPLEEDRNQFILLDDHQAQSVYPNAGAISFPRAIVGPPGSGKTLVLFTWLVHALQANPELFSGKVPVQLVTREQDLANWLQEYLKEMLPDYHGPKIILTYDEYLKLPKDQLVDFAQFEAWFSQKANATMNGCQPYEVYSEFQWIHAEYLKAGLQHDFKNPLTQNQYRNPSVNRAYQEYQDAVGVRTSFFADDAAKRQHVFKAYLEYMKYLNASDQFDLQLPPLHQVRDARMKAQDCAFQLVDEFQTLGRSAPLAFGRRTGIGADPRQEFMRTGMSSLEHGLKLLGIGDEHITVLQTGHRGKQNISKMERQLLVLDDQLTGGRSRIGYRTFENKAIDVDEMPGTVDVLTLERAPGETLTEEDRQAITKLKEAHPIFLVPNEEEKTALRAILKEDAVITLLQNFHGMEAASVVLWGFYDQDDPGVDALNEHAKSIDISDLQKKSLKAARSKQREATKLNTGLMRVASQQLIGFTRGKSRVVCVHTTKKHYHAKKLINAMAEQCRGKVDFTELTMDTDDARQLAMTYVRRKSMEEAKEVYRVFLLSIDDKKEIYYELFPEERPAAAYRPSIKSTSESPVLDKEAFKAELMQRLYHGDIKGYLDILQKVVRTLPESEQVKGMCLPSRVLDIEGLPDLSNAVKKATQAPGMKTKDRQRNQGKNAWIRHTLSWISAHYSRDKIIPPPIEGNERPVGEPIGPWSFFYFFTEENAYYGYEFLEMLELPKGYTITLLDRYQGPKGPVMFLESLELSGIDYIDSTRVSFKALHREVCWRDSMLPSEETPGMCLLGYALGPSSPNAHLLLSLMRDSPQIFSQITTKDLNSEEVIYEFKPNHNRNVEETEAETDPAESDRDEIWGHIKIPLLDLFLRDFDLGHGCAFELMRMTGFPEQHRVHYEYKDKIAALEDCPTVFYRIGQFKSALYAISSERLFRSFPQGRLGENEPAISAVQRCIELGADEFLRNFLETPDGSPREQKVSHKDQITFLDFISRSDFTEKANESKVLYAYLTVFSSQKWAWRTFYDADLLQNTSFAGLMVLARIVIMNEKTKDIYETLAKHEFISHVEAQIDLAQSDISRFEKLNQLFVLLYGSQAVNFHVLNDEQQYHPLLLLAFEKTMKYGHNFLALMFNLDGQTSGSLLHKLTKSEVGLVPFLEPIINLPRYTGCFIQAFLKEYANASFSTIVFENKLTCVNTLNSPTIHCDFLLGCCMLSPVIATSFQNLAERFPEFKSLFTLDTLMECTGHPRRTVLAQLLQNALHLIIPCYVGIHHGLQDDWDRLMASEKESDEWSVGNKLGQFGLVESHRGAYEELKRFRFEIMMLRQLLSTSVIEKNMAMDKKMLCFMLFKMQPSQLTASGLMTNGWTDQRTVFVSNLSALLSADQGRKYLARLAEADNGAPHSPFSMALAVLKKLTETYDQDNGVSFSVKVRLQQLRSSLADLPDELTDALGLSNPPEVFQVELKTALRNLINYFPKWTVSHHEPGPLMIRGPAAATSNEDASSSERQAKPERMSYPK